MLTPCSEGNHFAPEAFADHYLSSGLQQRWRGANLETEEQAKHQDLFATGSVIMQFIKSGKLMLQNTGIAFEY